MIKGGGEVKTHPRRRLTRAAGNSGLTWFLLLYQLKSTVLTP